MMEVLADPLREAHMIRQPAARLACAAVLLLLAGCTAAAPRAPSTANRNVLSYDEMLQAGYADAFTTVQTLRPHWLVKHGATSVRAQSIKVYLDGSLLGSPEQLRQITTRSISQMQYLNGLQASERYGLDHDLGAIVVTTRRN
jgi:hypothetical protein